MNQENKIKQRLYESGILPQLSLCDGLTTAQIAAGLTNGGVSAVLLEDGQFLAEQIKEIRQVQPDMLIGVLVDEAASAQIQKGVDCYLVQGNDTSLHTEEIPVIAVCNSLSEIESCSTTEETIAVANYNIPLSEVRELRNAFPQLHLILGTAVEDNAVTYLKEPNVLAVLNHSILSGTLPSTEEDITQRANIAMNRAYNITTGHLGINTENREKAIALANELSALFGKPWRETAKSFLVGDLVEIMKLMYLGEKGHMGFLTNDLQRSIRFYQTKGVSFNMATYEKNAIVYFSQEFGGVAFHLTERPKA